MERKTIIQEDVNRESVKDMPKFLENKEGRVFPATETLFRNRVKLGLSRCSEERAKEVLAKEAANAPKTDELSAENEQLKARIAELEAKEAANTKKTTTGANSRAKAQ